MGRLELTGKIFGKLQVISFAYMRNTRSYWNCLCDCGNQTIVRGYNLTSGNSRTCGCSTMPHGGHGTRIYVIWRRMIQRCEDVGDAAYPRYGERGIKVFPEWRHDFAAFRNWALSHGYADNLTIDRKNNDGDYEPDNCQWLTRSENAKKGQLDRWAKAHMNTSEPKGAA